MSPALKALYQQQAKPMARLLHQMVMVDELEAQEQNARQALEKEERFRQELETQMESKTVSRRGEDCTTLYTPAHAHCLIHAQRKDTKAYATLTRQLERRKKKEAEVSQLCSNERTRCFSTYLPTPPLPPSHSFPPIPRPRNACPRRRSAR